MINDEVTNAWKIPFDLRHQMTATTTKVEINVANRFYVTLNSKNENLYI